MVEIKENVDKTEKFVFLKFGRLKESLPFTAGINSVSKGKNNSH